MSDQPAFSRRSLLKLASISPLALVACTTPAQDEAMKEALCSSTRDCTDKQVDPDKLNRVVKQLWAQFVAGAGGPNKVGGDVFAKAFEMSGTPVICNLDGFPGDGNHAETNACCRKCGEYAREEAGLFRKINADDFEKAWCKTKDEMDAKLARARRISGNAGSGGPGGLGCS